METFDHLAGMRPACPMAGAGADVAAGTGQLGGRPARRERLGRYRPRDRGRFGYQEYRDNSVFVCQPGLSAEASLTSASTWEEPQLSRT